MAAKTRETLTLSAKRVREFCRQAEAEVAASLATLRAQGRIDDLTGFRLSRLEARADGLAVLAGRAEAALAEEAAARLPVTAMEFTLISPQWARIRHQRRDHDLVIYGWLTRKIDPRSEMPRPVLFLVPGSDELTSALAKMQVPANLAVPAFAD